MTWFEQLFGFAERGYEETQSQFVVEDCADGGRAGQTAGGVPGRAPGGGSAAGAGLTLRSRANGRAFGIGHLELASLAELRERVARAADTVPRGRPVATVVQGNVRHMHADPAAADALFQVASQFNLLEMVSERVTPEDGVTGYASDNTQGPACALAAAAATVYRNYFTPFGAQLGQRADRQLDALAELGAHLAERTGLPVARLWTMRNGYALCTEAGLDAIGAWLAHAPPEAVDAARAHLRVGLHWDVQTTDPDSPGHRVSQAFCSALPVDYGGAVWPRQRWAPFARLVLEAAYEATLLAAACNAARGGSTAVYLTRLGGGVFRNDADWIDAAMRRALGTVGTFALDVRLVSYGTPSPELLRLQEAYPAAA